MGGYGRRELCPGSDLDLILLHRGGRRDRTDVHKLAEKLWYPIWDRGLKLGHAVRTVKEAVALAGSDLNTATAQLDTRLLAGDPELAEELARRAATSGGPRAPAGSTALRESVAERHERAGEVAFLLEPDLKEGRGGLRDVHALRWAEAARRILVEGDDDALHAAHGVVLEARIELQRRTGKGSDRLLLQEQDGVAAGPGRRRRQRPDGPAVRRGAHHRLDERRRMGADRLVVARPPGPGGRRRPPAGAGTGAAGGRWSSWPPAPTRRRTRASCCGPARPRRERPRRSVATASTAWQPRRRPT